MVAFAPIVQADFSGTAFGGVPTWTDITRFARLGPSPIRITKWRQDQLSDVAPSTMTLVLDNADLTGDATAPNAGRFTPFLTSSPWSPHILPGVRIRVGVIVNAVTYWRFDGYVDVWDASYDNGEFGICTVSGSDILARLGTVDELRALAVEEILVDGPLAFYPLTEPAGSSLATSIAGARAPTLLVRTVNGGGDHTFGGATGIATDSTSTLALNTTLTAAAGDDLRGDFLTQPLTAGFGQSGGVTIEAWISIGSTLASAMSRYPGVPVPVVTLFDLGAPQLTAELCLKYSAGNVYLCDLSANAAIGPALNDGGVHHVVVQGPSVGAGTAYVDGVSYALTNPTFGIGGAAVATIGGNDPSGGYPTSNGFGAGGLAVGPAFRGGIGYVAIHTGALSLARVQAHYAAGKTAFAGEATATHISRLLTYRKNLGSTLDTGQGTVAAHATAGVSEQQALLDTGKAEGGLIYADPSTGKIVFLDRTHLRNPAAVLTLDVTAQQTTDDLNVRADRDLLLNDVSISRPGGGTQRKTDATSKNTYGTKGLSATLIIGGDNDAANAAGWLVANGKDVRARTPALSVDLLTEPSLTVAAGVLNLVPLQRVTLSNPPASMAAADVIVQGCTDEIGVGVFTCAFNVTPMPRPTLRFDAAADAFTKLDLGNVFAW